MKVNRLKKTIIILISVFVPYLTGCSSLVESPNIKPTTIPAIAPYVEPEYSENFFTMSGEPIDFNALPEPIELFYHAGANGPVRLLDYGIVMALTLEYNGQENQTDIGYMDERFVTSENISTGSTKAEVLAAYQKYGVVDVLEGYKRNTGNTHSELELYLKNGVEEYSMEELGSYGWLRLVKALAKNKGNINTNDLLYIDNGTPNGIEQFGGLVALIFIFNDFDVLQMIIRTAPTSG